MFTENKTEFYTDSPAISTSAAPQITLRDCSKEAVEGRSTYTVLEKAEFNNTKCSFYKGFSDSHRI